MVAFENQVLWSCLKLRGREHCLWTVRGWDWQDGGIFSESGGFWTEEPSCFWENVLWGLQGGTRPGVSQPPPFPDCLRRFKFWAVWLATAWKGIWKQRDDWEAPGFFLLVLDVLLEEGQEADPSSAFLSEEPGSLYLFLVAASIVLLLLPTHCSWLCFFMFLPLSALHFWLFLLCLSTSFSASLSLWVLA